QDEKWRDLALAALFVFAGTLTRYEGWALAAVGCVLVFLVTTRRRVTSTILFMGAAVLGPMLWMLYNMGYFADPLIFTYGIGSALINETGKAYGTSGRLLESFLRYFIDVAYSVNSGVLWLGLGGFAYAVFLLHRIDWRPTLVLIAGCVTIFGFYVL